MRIVLQRVSKARVEVDGETSGEIGHGLLVLLGVENGDTLAEIEWGVEKTATLRIFSDDQGKMNLSLEDVHGGALVVSQFTLLGDAGKGRRPSFVKAASPQIAIPLYEGFVRLLKQRGIQTETGVFATKMSVSLVNEGPVTILLDRRSETVTDKL